MAELSPQAQVMIAVTHIYQEHGGEPPARAIAAAALRAAAGQVVTKLAGIGQESAWYLEEIAAELENQ